MEYALNRNPAVFKMCGKNRITGIKMRWKKQ